MCHSIEIVHEHEEHLHRDVLHVRRVRRLQPRCDTEEADRVSDAHGLRSDEPYEIEQMRCGGIAKVWHGGRIVRPGSA
jgi:hypothetical protein